MANTTLQRLGISAGDRTKWTFSAWVKRSKLGTDAQHIFSSNAERTGTYNYTSFYFDNDQLRYYEYYNSAIQNTITTNAKYRDVNGFYHFVLVYDTAQSTASNRVKLYVNGEQVNSFATTSYPGLSEGSFMNVSGYDNYIGNQTTNGAYPFSGSMSHIHFTDGYAYDASAFGETDATTGEWVGKTSPSVTYGTNGFFILKDGNGITDQSGEGNDFTLGGGTLTDLKDNPDNTFATLNPLNVPTSNPPTFSNGNNTSITNTTTGAYRWGGSTTLGMTSGKFYCEAKATVDSTYSRNSIGITGNSSNLARTNESIQNTTASCGYYSEDGSVAYNGSGNISGFNTSYTTGDIIGMAFDLDNGKLYYSKNGTFLNSGNPTSGSTGTGAVSILAASTTPDGAYFFAQSDETGSSSPSKFEFNFGNGYFGTTAVTTNSGNGYSGAEGASKFNYTVPTGYSALSTKGLNE